MKLEWNGLLTIDGDEIDNEHRALFELYNAVRNSLEDEPTRVTLLSRLLEYANNHFRHEEALMLSSSYPPHEVAEHRLHHEGFFKQLRALEGSQGYLLLDFFEEWILRHIMIDDLKFGQFLKGK